MSVATAIEGELQSGTAGASAQRRALAYATPLLVVVGGLAVTALFAVNSYTSQTRAAIGASDANMVRFQRVYSDVSKARLSSLNLATQLLLQNDEIVRAFTMNDRAALQAKTQAFYEKVLRPHYGVAQFGFFTPPAISFLRVHNTARFGDDLSAVRNIIVSSARQRQPLSGFEFGIAGPGYRSVVPVVSGEKVIGTIELGGDVSEPLAAARHSTGLEYAFGIDIAAMRALAMSPRPNEDVQVGTMVYGLLSQSITRDLLRGLEFDPDSGRPVLIKSGRRSILVRSFPVNDFAGVPVARMTVLDDLTATLADIAQGVAIWSILLALLTVGGGLVCTYRYRQIRDSLRGAFAGRLSELEARLKGYDALAGRVKELDNMKRGFITNVVAAMNEPLLAISGHVQAAAARIERQLGHGEDRDRALQSLHFATQEMAHVSSVLDDLQQIEFHRQRLASADKRRVVDIVALIHGLAARQSAPRIALAPIDEARPLQVLAEPQALQRALLALFRLVNDRDRTGEIRISLAVGDAGKVKIVLDGPAFVHCDRHRMHQDEIRRFLEAVGEPTRDPGQRNVSTDLILVRLTAEHCGGDFSVDESSPNPRFVLTLPLVDWTRDA